MPYGVSVPGYYLRQTARTDVFKRFASVHDPIYREMQFHFGITDVKLDPNDC
jgi:hypothetical protein